uniref:Plant heme peroxidase family profile domain-containing protein n=1 Tax=Aegilops tauschii subsp. strangulata TaxID=200361 RepID=A0A453LUZ9_AEGTS
MATRDVIGLVRARITHAYPLPFEIYPPKAPELSMPAYIYLSAIQTTMPLKASFPSRAQAGGPAYPVELGRLDGLVSTASNVDGNLPPPSFNLDQLTAMFAANNLSQADMIALSGKARQLVLKRCLLTAPAIANPPNYFSRCLCTGRARVRKYTMCSVFLSCNPHKAGRKGLDSVCGSRDFCWEDSRNNVVRRWHCQYIFSYPVRLNLTVECGCTVAGCWSVDLKGVKLWRTSCTAFACT